MLLFMIASVYVPMFYSESTAVGDGIILSQPISTLIKNETICPNLGPISVEVKDSKGHLEILSVHSKNHDASVLEKKDMNVNLSEDIGIKSISIGCGNNISPLISMQLFPKDTTKGIVKTLSIEWNKSGYTVMPAVYSSR